MASPVELFVSAAILATAGALAANAMVPILDAVDAVIPDSVATCAERGVSAANITPEDLATAYLSGDMSHPAWLEIDRCAREWIEGVG